MIIFTSMSEKLPVGLNNFYEKDETSIIFPKNIIIYWVQNINFQTNLHKL